LHRSIRKEVVPVVSNAVANASSVFKLSMFHLLKFTHFALSFSDTNTLLVGFYTVPSSNNSEKITFGNSAGLLEKSKLVVMVAVTEAVKAAADAAAVA